MHPETPAEWQTAVDAAAGALALAFAAQYGLVDVDLCAEILNAGRKRGIVPSPIGAKNSSSDLSSQ